MILRQILDRSDAVEIECFPGVATVGRVVRSISPSLGILVDRDNTLAVEFAGSDGGGKRHKGGKKDSGEEHVDRNFGVVSARWILIKEGKKLAFLSSWSLTVSDRGLRDVE